MIFLSILRRELNTKLRSPQFYIVAVLSPILFLIPLLFSVFGDSRSVTEQKSIAIAVLVPSSLELDSSVSYRGLNISLHKEKATEFSHYFPQYKAVVDLSDYANWAELGGKIKVYMESPNRIKQSDLLRQVESWLNYQKTRAFYVQSKLTPPNKEDSIELSPLYTEQEDRFSIASTLAYTIGMLIYLTLILYNNNLLRSMTEEKNSKLAEVLSIYVHTRKLVLGKILGMSMASLLQVLLWICAYILYFLGLIWYDANYVGHYDANVSPLAILKSFFHVDLTALTALGLEFPVFLLLGIILNGAIFATIASLSNAKSGKMLVPFGNMLTILSIYFGMYVAGSPDSDATHILTYIPLASYIVVPVITVYGIAKSTILISLAILLLTVVLMLFVAISCYKKSLRT